ncbi:nicotiana lesion-inducing like, partial [Striga asiatica]
RHWKLHFNNPPQILLPETLIPPQITNPQILIRRDSLSPRRRGSKKSHPTALTPPSSSSKKNPSGPPKQTKPRAPPLFNEFGTDGGPATKHLRPKFSVQRRLDCTCLMF